MLTSDNSSIVTYGKVEYVGTDAGRQIGMVVGIYGSSLLIISNFSGKWEASQNLKVRVRKDVLKI